MPNYPGHILTEDVVVNYKKSDRDDCLHFLTHIDTSCHDLASFVSPTAKRIYTSVFNAWFLKINFNVKHMDVQGFDTDKSFKITYKGNKYIYSFINTKFSTGSVALLLHGAFGTYLYTGNFCYHSTFVRSPVLLPVIKEKALNRLYLDNTYYEQASDFLGFDEIVSRVVELIKSEPLKKFYIYADKVTMDPLLAEIASKLEEKVYVSQSTMEIMKFLGYESFFTRHSYESRIFTNKTLITKKDLEHDSITVHLNRFSDPSKVFKKIEKKGNVYNFNFYCHSRHKEICELLKLLKPESMTFLFSDVDKAKISYDLEFENDFPRTVEFKSISAKSSKNIEGAMKVVKNTPKQLILPTTGDKTAEVIDELGSKRMIILKNQDIMNINNGVKNLALITSKNKDGCLEINNAGSPTRLNYSTDVNKCTENLNLNSGLNYKYSNEVNNSHKNIPNCNLQSHSSFESFQNYHNHKPKQLIKLIKLQDNTSTGDTLVPKNIKSLSSCSSVVQKKTGIPLVFNRRLVGENVLNRTNSKIMKISNIGMVFNGKNNTILVKKKYVDVKKPCLITVPPYDIEKTIPNHVENERHLITKKPVILLKSKTCDTNSNIKGPVLNFNQALLLRSRNNNPVLRTNNSLPIPQIDINKSEESMSFGSQNCDRDSIEFEASENNVNEDMNSDLLINRIELQPDCDINKPSEVPAEFDTPGDNRICTGKKSNDDSTLTTIEKSVIDDNTTDRIHCKLTSDPKLVPSNKSSKMKNENEFCENNCLGATEGTSVIIPKRRLSDDENIPIRKKLRSDHLRQCLLQSNRQNTESVSLKNCSVLVRRNGFEKSYFYCSQRNCYLPKFFGFKKHQVRPRTLLIDLRNIQKLLNP